jgi:hypothetical protein
MNYIHIIICTKLKQSLDFNQKTKCSVVYRKNCLFDRIKNFASGSTGICGRESKSVHLQYICLAKKKLVLYSYKQTVSASVAYKVIPHRILKIL